MAESDSSYTFADLFGILEGQFSTSEEEIEAVLYRLTPEQEDEIATLPRQGQDSPTATSPNQD